MKSSLLVRYSWGRSNQTPWRNRTHKHVCNLILTSQWTGFHQEPGDIRSRNGLNFPRRQPANLALSFVPYVSYAVASAWTPLVSVAEVQLACCWPPRFIPSSTFWLHTVSMRSAPPAQHYPGVCAVLKNVTDAVKRPLARTDFVKSPLASTYFLKQLLATIRFSWDFLLQELNGFCETSSCKRQNLQRSSWVYIDTHHLETGTFVAGTSFLFLEERFIWITNIIIEIFSHKKKEKKGIVDKAAK